MSAESARTDPRAEQLSRTVVPHHDSFRATGDTDRRTRIRGGARRVQRPEPSEERLGGVPGGGSPAPRARGPGAGIAGCGPADLPIRPRPTSVDHADDRVRLPAAACAALQFLKTQAPRETLEARVLAQILERGFHDPA